MSSSLSLMVLSPLVLSVLGAIVVFSAEKQRHVPRLEIVDPAVALDSVRDQIQAELLTLFQQRYGPDLVFPPGLSVEAVGEHIYQGVTRLEALQDIYLYLFEQGLGSPYFETAVAFLLSFL